MKKILSTLLVACTMLSPMQAQDYEEVWIYPDGNFPELNGHENDNPRTTERWTAQPYMHIYRADKTKAAARTLFQRTGHQPGGARLSHALRP